jgi:hypothetical protein
VLPAQSVIVPVANVQVDWRDVWRALNRPDEGNLVTAQGSKCHPLFLPAPVERSGVFDVTRTNSG